MVATTGMAAIMAAIAAVTTVAAVGAGAAGALASDSVLAGAGHITVMAIPTGSAMAMVLLTLMAMATLRLEDTTTRVMTSPPILMATAQAILTWTTSSRNNRSNTSSSHATISNNRGIIQTRTRCRTDRALMAIRPLPILDIQDRVMLATRVTKNG